MTIVYRTYSGPITSTGETGIRLNIWQDDTNHVFDKYIHPYKWGRMREEKNTSFEREYSLIYMGEKIPVRAPSRDILTELEDVP